jgi:hypothetical protein
MEAEFSGEGRRRRVLLIVGGLLALVAAGATFYFSRSAPAEASPVVMQSIVVAAQDIPARTIITSAMVATAQMPASPLLGDVLADASGAVGKVAAVGIQKNQLISIGLLGTGAAGGGISILSPDETISPDSPVWRAVSVLVSKDRAVGGMLLAGQHVDLIATIDTGLFDATGKAPEGPLPSSGYMGASSTKLTWLDVEILSANVAEDLYVLKMDEHQAEELAHFQASDATSFSIGLRPEADTRDVDRSAYGETNNRIFEQYDFPIPQAIDVNSYPQPSPLPTPFSNLPWGSSPAPVPDPDPSASPAPSTSAAPPSASPAPTATPAPPATPVPTATPKPTQTPKP